MLKVGLVGYGFMGHMHAQCYVATGEAQMVAVADVDPAKRAEAESKGWKAYPSVEAMLEGENLDIVDICTPTYLHEKHVVAAAGKVKHIMCEKPMSISVESCDRMIEAVERSGATLMIAQVIRFWPEYAVIKELVDSGKYGKVKWLSAHRRSPFPSQGWENWFADLKKSGGAALDLHIHDLDYINYLVGLPKKVDARGTDSLNSILTTGWEHEGGAKSYAEGTFELAPGFPFNMALLVACEGATFKFDMSASPSLMVYPFEGEAYAPELPKPNIGASTETSGNISDLGGYYNEIKYFIDCVKSGREPEVVTPKDAREAVRVCLAVTESAKTDQVVDL
ncbi:MAG: Gfo/Idh/MocA family protein [Armatimonadota bacterium]